MRHPLLAGLASSAIVVMLSVAVLNEALEIRRRRRWSVLAQYVMLELVRDARIVWTGMLDLTGLMPPGANDTPTIEAAARVVRDTPPLTEAIRKVLADPERRHALGEHVSRMVARTDEVLGRWAAVMLNADAYAEVVDRHVELAGDLAWIAGRLEPPAPGNGDELWRHPAVQIGGELDDDTLALRLVTITQLAEQLDTGTLALALKIVPVEWWQARLEPNQPSSRDGSEANGRAQIAADQDRT